MKRHVRTKKELKHDLDTETKLCTKCGKRKPFNEWYKCKRTVDKLSTRCKSCDTEARHAYHNKHNERVRLLSKYHRLWSKYRITADQYYEMLVDQKECCAICGRHFTENIIHAGTGKFLSVDHCHTTGAIRGLLCNQCNRGLGILGDTYNTLAKAADYLRRAERDYS